MNTYKRSRSSLPALPLFLLLLALNACTRAAPPATPISLPTLTATLPATQLPTIPPLSPTATGTSTSTLFPSPTLSPTPYQPFNVTAMVDSLMLRTNPGYLFPALLMMPKDTSLLVLGQAPGGDWIKVQMSSGEKGWVFAKLLVSGQPLNLVPYIQPEGVQLVKGHVATANNVPVNGIQFAITQGEGANASRNDAVADANGDFYLFMPPTASGEWYVSYVAIGCESNLMDANCNWKNSAITQPTPPGITITLPYTETLNFVWK